MSRTLVLLHGAASNSTRWAEFRESTRLKDWAILAPDLRGNASAAAPRTPLGMDAWCADIAALLDAHGAARAVIVGHCLGASIALRFVARFPARVAGLVLVEPMPPEALIGMMRTLARLKPLLYALYGAARMANTIGIYRRRLEILDLREWDRGIRSGKVRLSAFASLAVDLRSTPLAAYTRMLAATVEPWPDVGKIAVPVLALLSTQSSFTDLARTRRVLAALRDCDIVELDAVHWIPTEQPEAMCTAIEHWLARRAPEKAP
ncbi:MAG TPA: alpha/beta hydrolase [Burkholderiales bacterium]|nr:alpha/beta hydrolase [Burkholderiales bacterium]